MFLHQPLISSHESLVDITRLSARLDIRSQRRLQPKDPVGSIPLHPQSDLDGMSPIGKNSCINYEIRTELVACS
jgi:hypothetical protein